MPTPHAAAVKCLEAMRALHGVNAPKLHSPEELDAAYISLIDAAADDKYAPLAKAAKWLLSTDNLEGQIAATVALRRALAAVKGEKL